MWIFASAGGLLLDLLLGDPETWPHPVRLMGYWIQKYLEKTRYRRYSPAWQRVLGLGLILSLMALTWLVTSGILWGAGLISPWVKGAVTLYLIYTCFSVRNLADEALKVVAALATGGLSAGRQQVSRIVGRDTTTLSQEEVVKAVIETVAENTSDGFIAPLFFILWGGPVGGLLYKAVNTLDSMVGYAHEPYRAIGFFAAKLDDVANWIPARLTWVILWLASLVTGLDWKQAAKIGWRDRLAHASPNSGHPEAIAAGALGIQLGGTHVYHGQVTVKPVIGDALKPATPAHVYAMVRLLYVGAGLGWILLSALRYLITALWSI